MARFIRAHPHKAENGGENYHWVRIIFVTPGATCGKAKSPSSSRTLLPKDTRHAKFVGHRRAGHEASHCFGARAQSISERHFHGVDLGCGSREVRPAGSGVEGQAHLRDRQDRRLQGDGADRGEGEGADYCGVGGMTMMIDAYRRCDLSSLGSLQVLGRKS